MHGRGQPGLVADFPDVPSRRIGHCLVTAHDVLVLLAKHTRIGAKMKSLGNWTLPVLRHNRLQVVQKELKRAYFDFTFFIDGPAFRLAV